MGRAAPRLPVHLVSSLPNRLLRYQLTCEMSEASTQRKPSHLSTESHPKARKAVSSTAGCGIRHLRLRDR